MNDTSDAQIKSEMDAIIKNIDAILKKVEQLDSKSENSADSSAKTIK